jgi:hypothetical protein
MESAMSDVVLVLGPVLFTEFEVPARINFGGRQRVVVHALPGGARVIDVLGRDDAQISFSGIFSGIDATLRARTLNDLRSAGVPLALTWDTFFYTVLITELQVDYQNGRWIPYRIVCTVLQDEASITPNIPISLIDIISADMDAAASYGSDAALNMSVLQNALSGPGAMYFGTQTSATTQALLVAIQATIRVAMRKADDIIQSSDLTLGNAAQDGATVLVGATDAMGQLSSLVTVSSYVSRLMVNLMNASM